MKESKILKRLLPLMLTAMMVLAMAACGGSQGSPSTSADTSLPGEQSQSEASEASSETGSETGSEASQPSQPAGDASRSGTKNDGKIDLGTAKYDFKGAEITIASIWPKSWGFEKASVSESAALWKEWRDLVEKTYNCKLKMKTIKGNDTQNQLISKIASGDKVADIIECQRIDVDRMYLAKGMLQDLTKVPGLNLKDPRWSQGAIEAATWNNAVYGVAGYQENLQTGFLVNLDLLATLKVDDPFKQVENMKWNFDAFYKLAKNATKDLNGNGKIEDNIDQFGVFLFPTALGGLLEARGVRLMTVDSKGKASYALNTAANKKVIKEIKENLITPGYHVTSSWDSSFGEKMFKDGRLLLWGAPVAYAKQIVATTKIKVGWLPIPTADGKKYIDVMDGWSNMICLSSTNKDTTKAVAILNASLAVREKAYELYIEDIWSAYYSTSPKSKENMKKVFFNKVYPRHIQEVVPLKGYQNIFDYMFGGHDLEQLLASTEAESKKAINDTYNS